MKCPSCGGETHGRFCEYCGSEMPQENPSVTITNNYFNSATPDESREVGNSCGGCPRCGNSKITFKRERAGTATQSRYSGKKGQSVSQAVYRTVGICQNCGYTWDPNATSSNNGVRTSSGNKTWLWVLGWICIFPLPLTILLFRKKEIKPAVKYSVIAVAWIIFFAIGMSGNNDTDTTTPDDSAHTESTHIDQPTSNPTIDDNQTEDSGIIYADDIVVNRFITEFNENSSLEITDISKGNIQTKYFGYSNGRYLEMINATGATAKAFCLKINGGQEDTDKQSMYEVCREAVKILDAEITDEMIDAMFAEFDTRDILIEGYVIGNSITVTYVPTKELSYGKNSCRIDIYASSYK